MRGTGCSEHMKRPNGRDACVERAGEGKIGTARRGNERLHVGEFEIGPVELRMQRGVRVKYRLAARRRRSIERAAEGDARGAALELRMLDGDLRRRIQA